MSPLIKFCTRYSFFRLLCALVGGVLVSDHFHLSLFLCVAMMGFSLLIALIACRRAGFGVVVFLFFFWNGAFLATLQQCEMRLNALPESAVWQAELADYPIEARKTYRLNLHVKQYVWNDSLYACSFRMLAYVPKEQSVSQLSPGTWLQFGTKLRQTASEADTASYSRYLYREGYAATAYFTDYMLLPYRASSMSLRGYFSRFRRQMLQQLDAEPMSDEVRALLHAVALGDKTLLDRNMKAAFSAAGVSHLLAVSGLHLGILVAVVGAGIGVVLQGRRRKIVYSLLICMVAWGYALLSGLSPSVVRAAAMLSLFSLSAALGRKGTLFHILFLSAFVMISFNPAYIYSVSFQLSYLALLSIVCYYPLFQPLGTSFYHLSAFRYLLSILWVSISAQLGTFPLILYYFQSFPVYFLCGNLLLVPASFLLLLLMLCYFLCAPFPVLQAVWAILPVRLAQAMLVCVQYISSLPHALLTISVNGVELLLLYLILFALSYWVMKHNRRAFLGAWFLWLLYLVV